jgi:hypothetical protein
VPHLPIEIIEAPDWTQGRRSGLSLRCIFGWVAGRQAPARLVSKQSPVQRFTEHLVDVFLTSTMLQIRFKSSLHTQIMIH